MPKILVETISMHKMQYIIECDKSINQEIDEGY
jgi:hypothetical protein